jgi:hypothetical protein
MDLSWDRLDNSGGGGDAYDAITYVLSLVPFQAAYSVT